MAIVPQSGYLRRQWQLIEGSPAADRRASVFEMEAKQIHFLRSRVWTFQEIYESIYDVILQVVSPILFQGHHREDSQYPPVEPVLKGSYGINTAQETKAKNRRLFK